MERDVGRPALVPLCDGCATEGVSEVEMDRAVEVMERREERGGRQVGARVKVER